MLSIQSLVAKLTHLFSSSAKYSLKNLHENTFKTMFPDNDNLCYSDLIEFFKKLGPGNWNPLSDMSKVFELILVLPT